MAKRQGSKMYAILRAIIILSTLTCTKNSDRFRENVNRSLEGQFQLFNFTFLKTLDIYILP